MTYDLGDLPLSPLPGFSPPVTSPPNTDNMNPSFFHIDVIASALRLHDLCDRDMSRSAKTTLPSDERVRIPGQQRRSTEPDVFIFPPPAHLLDNSCDSSLNLSNITTETPSTSFASSSSASLVSAIPSSVVSSHVNSLSLASSTSSGSDVTSAHTAVTSAPNDVIGNSGYIASPGVFSPICVSTPHYVIPSTASTPARPFSANHISSYEMTHRFRPMSTSPDVNTSDCSVLNNTSMIANPSTCSLSGSCADMNTSSLSTEASSLSSDTYSLAHAPSTRQWERLTAEFHNSPYPTRKDKSQLARTLGMRVADITRWFKNARRRYRCAMRKESLQVNTF